MLCKGVFVHHGGYSGSSRTIFQGFSQGAKMFANALYNVTVYGRRHGFLHTAKYITEGILGSITGYKTISSEVGR